MIYYEDPGDIFTYIPWIEGSREFEIWYRWDEIIDIRDGDDGNVPEPILKVVRRWTERVGELKAGWRDPYEVRFARISFIYGDKVYCILPATLGAESDAMLESLANEIRKDLRASLNVERTAYSGVLAEYDM